MGHAIDPLTWLQKPVDQFRSEGVAPAPSLSPPVNLWEDRENLYAEAEMPGFRIDDLEVTAAGSELLIRARRAWTLKQGAVVHRRERPVGEWARSLMLPVPIDADKIHALLQDGVLTITIPKAEIAKPRKIDVRLPGAQK